jgi:hypothetical protein
VVSGVESRGESGENGRRSVAPEYGRDDSLRRLMRRNFGSSLRSERSTIAAAFPDEEGNPQWHTRWIAV